jgi:hypothetical protein
VAGKLLATGDVLGIGAFRLLVQLR